MEHLDAQRLEAREAAFARIKERQIVEPETGVKIDPYDGYVGVNWATTKDAEYMRTKIIEQVGQETEIEEYSPNEDFLRLEVDAFYGAWMKGVANGKNLLGIVMCLPADLPFLRDLLEDSLQSPSEESLDFIIESIKPILAESEAGD